MITFKELGREIFQLANLITSPEVCFSRSILEFFICSFYHQSVAAGFSAIAASGNQRSKRFQYPWIPKH